MERILLPQEITIKEKSSKEAQIVITPCYPGYGTTLGNALRRVLLSSLEGAAATAVKIKNATHEFTTLTHVKEDMIEVILNLKGLRFQMDTDEPQEIHLSVKGEKKITGKDFEKNTLAKVVNLDHHIATLTDKSSEFELDLRVERGLGYVPVEMRTKEKLPVGYIAIDAIYTPLRNVNFRIEHVRVGEMTNYDKLILDIVTDGSIAPGEALKTSAQILNDHFQFIASGEMKIIK